MIKVMIGLLAIGHAALSHAQEYPFSTIGGQSPTPQQIFNELAKCDGNVEPWYTLYAAILQDPQFSEAVWNEAEQLFNTTCLTAGVDPTIAMFYVAARTLAEEVDEDDLSIGRIYPPLRHIRDVSAKIAAAVADIAFERGLATEDRPDDLEAFIRERMFEPDYPVYG